MKNKIKICFSILSMILIILVTAACGKQDDSSSGSENSNYEYDKTVLNLVQKTFNEKLAEKEFEDLEATITYMEQKGFILDTPVEISSDNTELVEKLIKSVTNEIKNDFKFKSKRLQNNDKIVVTIIAGEATLTYDKNE